LVLCFASCANAQFLRRGVYADKIWPLDYSTNRTAATLNSVISGIGTQTIDVIINGGVWTIDDDVTFPSTARVIVERGSRFTVSAGKTLTVNGYFHADSQWMFAGAGSVQLTDDMYVYEHPAWDLSYLTGSDPILKKIIKGVQAWNSSTGAVYSVGAGAQTQKSVFFPPTPISYIQGFYPDYKDGSTISMTPGEAWVNGNLARSTQTLDITVGPFVAGTNVYHAYFDYSAITDWSQLNGGAISPDFYLVNVAPQYDPDNRGYYHPTTTEDRYAGSVSIINSTLYDFDILNTTTLPNRGYQCIFSNAYYAVSNVVASGNWQSTQAGSYVPVTATRVLLRMVADDSAGAQVKCEVKFGQLPGFNPQTPLGGIEGIEHAATTMWVPCNGGATTIQRRGFNTNTNSVQVIGWEILER